VPFFLIGTALSEVIKEKAHDSILHKKSLHSIVKKTAHRLFILGVIPTLIFMATSSQIFSLIFGEEWKEAGVYAQILAPMFFIRFIVTPVSCIALLKNKTKLELYWQILFLFTSCGAYFFSDSQYSLITYFSIAFSFLYLISFYVNLQLSKES
jgi:O-antigen/teichoic acid export membrane protein